MSRQTIQLLEAFESLPEDEKRLFTEEFLRRQMPFDSGSFDDEESTLAADALISGLDTNKEHRSCSLPPRNPG